MRTNRAALAGFTLAGALLSTGCLTSPSRVVKHDVARPSFQADIQAACDRHNDNGNRIQSLQCDNVVIMARAEGQAFTVNAQLGYQRPNLFRMVGRVAGSKEVDVGSNAEEIWFWAKRNKPPAVLYCARPDLDRVQLNLPFAPDDLIEVLGVVPIDFGAYRMGHANDRAFSIERDHQNPNGRTVTKRIVFDRRRERVSHYEVWDRGRGLLARATIEKVQKHAGTGATVPRKILMNWPEADTELEILFGDGKVKVNALAAAPEAMFSRTALRDYESYDMANLPSAPPRVAPAEVRGN